MEYLEGETLEHHLQGQRLPLNKVLTIGTRLCSVLDYLHQQKPPIIFRNVKPDNILLTPHGNISLISTQKLELVAALMGMNLGLEKMAESCPYTYRQLSWSVDWHVREETLLAALASLDNFVLSAPLSSAWGMGQPRHPMACECELG